MAEGNGEVSLDKVAERDSVGDRTEDYHKLIEYGLDTKVAIKLDEIYKTGKLAHSELDERALDALKEFPADGALNVLGQFVDSNLEHVSNKSAYLCGVMKTYRQKTRAGQQGTQTAVPVPTIKGPDEEKIKLILMRTGYTLDVTTGQRKYGGPPPGWEGSTPGIGCEVFCGKIPKDIYEDELIPLFEKCGTIWDLRLMMDPMTGSNRGYAFVTFTNREAATCAVKELDNHEIKPGKIMKINISVPNLRLFVGNIPKSKGKEEILDEFGKLTELDGKLNDYEILKGKKIGVTISFNNHRIFVGNIPKNRDRDDLFEEFTRHAPGLMEVIIYSSPDDKKKNRGFCFLEYDSHKAASLAKRRLSTGRIKVWGCDIIVDWADPQEEPDEQTMSKVKVLYVRNLTQDISEESLKDMFENYGKVERVKKIKDYAFIHFADRDNAVKAMSNLDGKDMDGSQIEVSLAKPPSDKKKKEEMLRARERRLIQMMHVRGGGGGGGGCSPSQIVMYGRGMRPSGQFRGPAERDYDYDYEYYGYGDYRGGYNEPYFRYDELYYDYATPTQASAARQGRIRAQPDGHGRGAGRATGAGGGAMRANSLGSAGNTRADRGPPQSTVQHNHRGNPRVKGNLPGKRKFEGGHQNQGGDMKRRMGGVGGRWSSRVSNPPAVQSSGTNGADHPPWHMDTYQTWS